MDLDNLYNAQQNDMNSQLQKLYAENISVISYFKEVDSYIKRILDSNSDTDTITKTTTLLENNLQPLSKLKYLIFDLEDEIPEALSKKWNKQVKYVTEMMGINEVSIFLEKLNSFEEKITELEERNEKQEKEIDKLKIEKELEKEKNENKEEVDAIIFELDKYRNHLFSENKNLLEHLIGLTSELDELREGKYFTLEEQLLKDIEIKLIPLLSEESSYHSDLVFTPTSAREFLKIVNNIDIYSHDGYEDAMKALNNINKVLKSILSYINSLNLNDILNNYQVIRNRIKEFYKTKIELYFFSTSNDYRLDVVEDIDYLFTIVDYESHVEDGGWGYFGYYMENGELIRKF